MYTDNECAAACLDSEGCIGFRVKGGACMLTDQCGKDDGSGSFERATWNLVDGSEEYVQVKKKKRVRKKVTLVPIPQVTPTPAPIPVVVVGGPTVGGPTPSGQCPEGTKMVGGPGADIPGCGLTRCDERYNADTIDDCAARCDKYAPCNSFTWADYGQDRNHKSYKVCTMYGQDRPQGTWGRDQLFCAPSDDHGCLASAGYSYCDQTGECLRPWEQACISAPPTVCVFEPDAAPMCAACDAEAVFANLANATAPMPWKMAEDGSLVLPAECSAGLGLLYEYNKVDLSDAFFPDSNCASNVTGVTSECITNTEIQVAGACGFDTRLFVSAQHTK